MHKNIIQKKDKYTIKLRLIAYQVIFEFQLESHESLLNVRSLNIQFFIHLQQAVSKQIQDCTQHVKVTSVQHTTSLSGSKSLLWGPQVLPQKSNKRELLFIVICCVF